MELKELTEKTLAILMQIVHRNCQTEYTRQ